MANEFLKPTPEMRKAWNRFAAASAAPGEIMREGDALQERKAQIRENYMADMGRARTLDAEADMHQRAQDMLSPGSSVTFQPGIDQRRAEAQALRDSATGSVNDWNEEWRTNRRDLAIAESQRPRYGVSPGGTMYGVRQEFKPLRGGGVAGFGELLSQDNRALVQMRTATPAEREQARQSRLGGLVGNGGATMGADTGMSVGSKAAEDHAAALARHTGRDIIGGGHSANTLASMRAANRAAGFGRVRLIGRAGAVVDENRAQRRADFQKALMQERGLTERAKIQGATDVKKAEWAARGQAKAAKNNAKGMADAAKAKADADAKTAQAEITSSENLSQAQIAAAKERYTNEMAELNAKLAYAQQHGADAAEIARLKGELSQAEAALKSLSGAGGGETSAGIAPGSVS